jgi:hypothetical protein
VVNVAPIRWTCEATKGLDEKKMDNILSEIAEQFVNERAPSQ